MRRNSRKKENKSLSISDKIIFYSGIGVAVLSIIVVALLLYSKSLSDDVRNETMSLEQIAKITGNTTENNIENSTSVSTEIGKSVEEAKNEMNTTKQNNSSNTTSNATSDYTKSNVTNTEITNSSKENLKSNVTETNAKTEKSEKTEKQLEFQKPVEGEIVREYARDNLIYSETLKEWTTHLGIDIKADKTTVVKSAETGTVKSIKNDPRYGLTIVIEHEDGYQTVYANLLTSEFVVEGEKVEKGQSLGTVGNTAVFESVDEAHLHFEILKDSIQVDPSIYIK